MDPLDFPLSEMNVEEALRQVMCTGVRASTALTVAGFALLEDGEAAKAAYSVYLSERRELAGRCKDFVAAWLQAEEIREARDVRATD